MKVFLGGTCNNSNWRNEIIKNISIDYFNPIVTEWNQEAQAREISERNTCDYCLYIVTPLMTGVYSIAEAVDDSNKRPAKTLFCFLESDQNKTFSPAQIESLKSVSRLITRNGGKSFKNLQEVIKFLNSKGTKT